jgi:hypothetical protein
MTQWFNSADWLQASGHPIVGRGFRPTQQHKQTMLALKTVKAKEAKLQRKQAWRRIITEVWVKTPVSEPKARRRTRTTTLPMGDYGLATAAQRWASDRVLQQFRKPR